MKRLLVILLLTFPLAAQELGALTDEFGSAESLARWTRFHAARGVAGHGQAHGHR